MLVKTRKQTALRVSLVRIPLYQQIIRYIESSLDVSTFSSVVHLRERGFSDTKMAATHLDVGLRCIKYLLCAVNSLFVVCNHILSSTFHLSFEDHYVAFYTYETDFSTTYIKQIRICSIMRIIVFNIYLIYSINDSIIYLLYFKYFVTLSIINFIHIISSIFH